jgi:acyl-CoA synthetase (NDP forming)
MLNSFLLSILRIAIMSQPIYPDLGKTVRDFFSKGYYFGIFKLNVKTRAPNGLESSATGTYNREKQTTVSEYEAKSFFPKYGLTTIAKWNTSNLVTTKLEVMDKLACGLKVDINDIRVT